MRRGGLLVVPAAPALKDLDTNPDYRDSLLQADLAITDSAFMILLWNFIEGDDLNRLSGLEYLRELLHEDEVRTPGNTLWIMASPASATRHLEWLKLQQITVPPEYVYMAPLYSKSLEDPLLVEILNRLRPPNVIVTVGGGTQERLGLYLKRNLKYLPAIHCIGAAIAFLSGDQVPIPPWADRLYLGWFLRCVSNPAQYVPRYWDARKLFSLMVRYRGELPPLTDRRLSS